MTVDFFFAGLPPVNCCILSLKLIECSSFCKRDGVGLSLLSSSVSFLSFKPWKLKEVGTVQQIMSWAHHGISLQYERVRQQNGKRSHIASFGPHLRLNYLQENSNLQHCKSSSRMLTESNQASSLLQPTTSLWLWCHCICVRWNVLECSDLPRFAVSTWTISLTEKPVMRPLESLNCCDWGASGMMDRERLRTLRPLV